jgi:hypothetical protein
MKKLSFLLVLLLAACTNPEHPRSLGIGVYPGNPAENFSPTLEKGSGYRNIALLRAARHSSSANYEQTAQLVTDGLVADGPAPWVEVFRNGEKLSHLDGSYLTDQNHAGIVCQGPEVELELDFHGFVPEVDRILVAMDRGRFQDMVLTVEGKADDGEWQPLGTATPSRQQENKLIIHGLEYSLPVKGNFGAYRFKFDNAPGYCPVSEVFFYRNDVLVDVLPSAFFVSSWKSAGTEDEWVSIDLGENSTFDKMSFAWVNGPLKATVQASEDGESWKDIAAFKGAEPEIKFSRAKGHYVRLCLSGTENGEPFELSEWEVYGQGGTRAVPHAAPAREGARQALSGGGWKLQRAQQVTFSGEEIASAGFDDADWLVATVPGTVLTTYIDNGAVPHPNFADNQLFISDSYFRSDFWYRNVFQAHPDTPRQFLHFEGINYQAIVYLNGRFLGVVDGAFRAADFDVTGILVDGDNALAVEIIHNPSYGAVKEQTAFTPQSNGGILGGDNPTMHASIGWDWIPTVRGRNIGIYDDVWLSFTGPVTIEDPFVRTELPLPDTTKATLFAQATVVNRSDEPVSGTLEWKFGDLIVSEPVELLGREDREVVFNSQTLENPRLWWPKGYGEQNLYPVSFRFIVDGAVSDTKEFLSGVRQMDFSMDTYTPLQGFQAAFEARNDAQRLSLYVNGRRFIGFGGNWGFPEHLLNYRAREYDAAVKYHADMNFTMIRNWVGMTGSRAFYEACDRHGILIWQDFWLANPWDGPDPLDPDRFNMVAGEYVRRIRNHPSIGLYVGRNEGYPPEAIDSFLKEMIGREHPGMYYIPHSATDGVSGGGPYNALKPAQYFRVRGRDKFHSEMGMPAVMNYENLVRAMGETALEPVNTLAHPNAMYGLHDYTLGRLANSAQQAESFNELIANAFGEPADAKKFAELAQWINYDGYRAMFESRGEYRRGLLLWMSHPAWPSMVWQTYDYYFEPTGAYFGCKKACEPLHIQLNLLTRNVEVVNYHAGDQAGLTAKVSVLDMDGKALDGYETPVDIPEDSTLVLAALPVPEDATDVYYVKLELADAAGTPLSENFYVQGKEEGNLQALNGLGKASVKVSFTGKGPWKAVLTNNGNVPALMLRLKLVSGASREMVLPVLYSDNYFSLLPGEKREISIEAAPEDLRGKAGLEVTGFNLDSKRL